MDQTTVELALSEAIAAAFAAESVSVEVRGAASAARLPAYDPYVLVTAETSVHEVGDLWSVSVSVSCVSPLLGPTADQSVHVALARRVRDLWHCLRYPLFGAALWQHGHVLHGWHVADQGRFREDGKLVEGVTVALAIQARFHTEVPAALPVSLEDLASAAAGVPGPSVGEAWLFMDRPVMEVPDSVAVVAVAVRGSWGDPAETSILEGHDPLNPLPAAEHDLAPGSVVFLGYLPNET